MPRLRRRAARGTTLRDPVAVVDIGSNSGRVMVFRPEAGGHLHVLAGSRAALRLARDLDRDRPDPARGARAGVRGAAGLPRDRAAAPGVRRIEAAGTSALRDAANGPPFIRRVKRELGITIRILSGLEEARYGFLGAVGGLPVDDGVFFDLGGGSLQVGRFREPAAAGGGERAARLAARLGRVPEVRPADAARAAQAARARARDARGGRAQARSRRASSWWAPAARSATWPRSTSAPPATRSRGSTATSSTRRRLHEIAPSSRRSGRRSARGCRG